MRSARTALCRDMSGDVGLVSGHVRQCRFIVGTCSEGLDYFRDMFVVVGFLSDSVRRGRLSVGTCTTSFFLESRRVRRGMVSVGRCSAMSV